MASASIYVMNDIYDVESDKKHPEKCMRPIASGRVSIRAARILSISCFSLALLLASLINSYSMLFVIAYILLMIAYTFFLKRIPYLDILIILTGFLLRVSFGSYVVAVHTSTLFIVIFISLLSLIAFGKRYSEHTNSVRSNNNFSTRVSLRGYNIEHLKKIIYAGALVSSISYLAWTLSSHTSSNTKIIFTLIYLLLMLIIIKYIRLIKNGEAEHPERIFLRDKTIIFSTIAILCLALINLFILY
jgi:4-hydroxybenzoate polyprenyltransferase